MKRLLLILILELLVVTGCSSYKDANLILFSVMTIVDVNEDNQPVIYMELFRALYDQEIADEKGERVILYGEGVTVAEAIDHVNHKATYRIHGAHNKTLVFTEKAAKAGLNNFLDYFLRDQEFLLRPYLLIYKGEPMDLLNAKNDQTRYLGLYFEQLLKNEVATAYKEPKRLYEYANERCIGAKTVVIDLLTIDNQKIKKENAVILKDDQFVETLTEDELIAFNTMMSNADEGYITVSHPNEKDKLITLEVIKRRIKTNIKYNEKTEEVVQFNKNISLVISFNETQGQINLEDSQTRKKIVEAVKKKIVQESEDTFNKFKKKGIDIFGVEAAFNRKYPNGKKEDVIEITKLNMTVDVIFEGSPDTEGFNN